MPHHHQVPGSTLKTAPSKAARPAAAVSIPAVRCHRKTVIATPAKAMMPCQAPARAVRRCTAGRVPPMMPNWTIPRRAMAKVGGVMLATPWPGMLTMATG